MRSEQRVRQPVLARNAYQLYVLQKIGIRALSTFALSLFQASRFRRSTYKTTKKKKFSFYHLRFGESSSTITLIIHVADKSKINRIVTHNIPFGYFFLLSFNRWLIWGMVTDSSSVDHARYSFWTFFLSSHSTFTWAASWWVTIFLLDTLLLLFNDYIRHYSSIKLFDV